MNKTLIILPKKNNSGGNTEVLYFINNLNSFGYKTKVKYLFTKKPNFKNIKDFIQITRDWYSIFKLSKKTKNIILTHYSTLFFALLFLHNKQLTILIQSAEWKVVSKFKYIQFISKLIHFVAFKKINNFIFANNILIEEFKNDYLISKIFENKFVNIILYPIGHNHRKSEYITKFKNRKNDIFLLLRNNWVKRYDLYIETLEEISNLYPPEILNEINIYIVDLSSKKLKLPSNKFNLKYSKEISHSEFKKILKESKLLLYLSCYEGFGLPPLEAMHEGCIPIITNNHGQYNYLRKNSKLVLDKESEPKVIANRVKFLLNGEDKELINNLNKLSEEAEKYYKYAEDLRRKQIKKIIKILSKSK